ncbi:ABC transporter substrate-binding protein [Paenibacillus macerans]|nr:ABC transporter substrate-binding protein [Paenibacillus macerans]
MQEFVKDFEKKHGVNVDVLAIPWGDAHDKLLTAVAAGKGPDVLQVGNTWVAEFAEAGAFLDLTDRLKDYPNLQPERFFESAAATTVYHGKTYAIPYIIDTRVLFYRTDLLGEAGYPKGPETWDEAVDAARKLAARGKGLYGIDIDKGSHHIPMMMAWEHGWVYDPAKGADSFDDPRFKAAMELYAQFFKEGLAQLEAGKETVQGFKDGTYPMFISGPYMVNTIKEQAPEIGGKWAVRVMPKVESNASMAGGSHLAVFHNTDKVDEALTFIDYMADPQTQVAWYQAASTLPTTKKAWEDPVFASDPTMQTFGEQLKTTQAFPVIAEYEFIASKLLKTLEQVIRGGADIDQALTGYREEVRKILAK